MSRLKTVPPEPQCDDCGNPVEESQIAKSVVNGIPLGPWQCKACEATTAVMTQAGIISMQHTQMLQDNGFDSICNEVDPALAEAIHRAKLL